MTTLLHDKMTAAGVNTPQAKLYTTAVEALAAADGDRARASLALARVIKFDPDMLRELAQFYIDTRVALDMRGPKEPTRDGQWKSAYPGQSSAAAPRGPFEGGGAAWSQPKGLITLAPPPSPNDASGATIPLPMGQNRTAPGASPHHDRAGQARAAITGQKTPARPVVNPPRGAEVIAAMNASLSLFDTIKVRGGIAIGDLTFGEADRLAATNEREARVLRELTGKVANADPLWKLRDHIKPQELAEAVGRNMEPSDG
jgi:hypothetical protein